MGSDELEGWHEKIKASPINGTPFMLTDLSVIRRNCTTFKNAFPGVQLFYAIKAFSDVPVLRTVELYADGFDAASFQEVKLLIDLGVAPSKIAFSNPVKSESAVADAARLGVNKFAFQSVDELAKIARAAPASDVYVRVKMNDSHSAVPLSSKYGCNQDEVVKLLSFASQKGLNPIGITFHIGSQQTSINAWRHAIRDAQKLVILAQKQGINARLINLGGGFPTQYTTHDPDIHDVAESVMSAIGEQGHLSYMAEPGRYIVADSSAIVASIIGREKRTDKTWIYLDVGAFQAFVGAMRFDKFPYPPISLRHSDNRSTVRLQEYVLTGPSCDSQDIITTSAHLPADLEVGDLLMFPHVGAYTIVYGSNFNGFPVPERYFINETIE